MTTYEGNKSTYSAGYIYSLGITLSEEFLILVFVFHAQWQVHERVVNEGSVRFPPISFMTWVANVQKPWIYGTQWYPNFLRKFNVIHVSTVAETHFRTKHLR